MPEEVVTIKACFPFANRFCTAVDEFMQQSVDFGDNLLHLSVFIRRNVSVQKFVKFVTHRDEYRNVCMGLKAKDGRCTD